MPSVFSAEPSQLLRGSSKLLFWGLVQLSFLLKLGLLEGPSQHSQCGAELLGGGLIFSVTVLMSP